MPPSGKSPAFYIMGENAKLSGIFLQSIWRVTFPINLKREDK